MSTTPKRPQPQASADLSRQFLLAMPGRVTGDLANTVIYVCEHTGDGALGLVINRPTDITVGDLLKRIDLDASVQGGSIQNEKVYFGGPVQTDRGFVLHSPVGGYTSTIELGDVALTTSRDVLQDVAKGEGPTKILVTLGYAGWGAGQLENEMSQNAWINVEASSDILFDVPAENRYQVALSSLGIDPIMLAGEAGHA